jgi:hypothetical protein
MIKQAAMVMVIACALLAACSRERQPCLSLKTAVLNVSCVRYRDTGNTFIDTALPRARLAAVTDSGVQIFYYSQPASLFTISLSPGSDTCRWLITTDSSNYEFDTLSMYYKRKLEFLSNACGYTYFYNLTGITTSHNNIDSVIITDPGVTNNVNSKHLRIYFHRPL